jgi:hypothetical protein
VLPLKKKTGCHWGILNKKVALLGGRRVCYKFVVFGIDKHKKSRENVFACRGII